MEVSMREENLCSPASTEQILNRSNPTPVRWLHVTLFLVAFAGWLIFIMACAGGPAWSPDGSQILFAYRDVANARTSVALYDRVTGKVSTIFTQPVPADEEQSPGQVALHPTWQKDGTRALVTILRYKVPNSSDEMACELISLPVKSNLPVHVYNLGFTPDCMNVPEIGDTIFFGGYRLNWINLATGEEHAKNIEGVGEDKAGVGFWEQYGRLYYKRGVKRTVTGPSGQPTQAAGMEFGRWQTEDNSPKPSFTLWDEDFSAVGVKHNPDEMFDISFGPNGVMGALSTPEGDKILFTENGKGIVRVLDPSLDLKSYSLGSLVWSQDGKTLYAPVLTRGDADNALNYELAEIPVAGGKAQLTKIAVIHSEMNDDLKGWLRSSMQVSQSPDGRWIAATPAVLGKGMVDDGDRALFLIDLHDPARHMEKVPIPPQPAEGSRQGF
jgi:WD40 repeat protein